MTDPRRAVSQYLRERGAARELAPSTQKTVKHTLYAFADCCPPDLTRLDRRHIIKWLGRNGHLADSTLANNYGTIRSFCRWLVTTRKIARDPTLNVDGPRRPRRRPRAMPYDAVEAVLNAAPTPRLRVAISLMLMEGLRLAEVSGLQLGDIDFDRRILHVYGKGNKHRAVPLTEFTAAAIRVYLATAPLHTVGPLIRSEHDPRRGITSGHLGRIVTDVMREAGVKERNRDGRSPHAFRHTAATDTLAAGATTAQVRDLLGHENIATTEVYIAPSEVEGLRAPMEARPYAKRLRAARDA